MEFKRNFFSLFLVTTVSFSGKQRFYRQEEESGGKGKS
jgi:hypothetical protein